MTLQNGTVGTLQTHSNPQVSYYGIQNGGNSNGGTIQTNNIYVNEFFITNGNTIINGGSTIINGGTTIVNGGTTIINSTTTVINSNTTIEGNTIIQGNTIVQNNIFINNTEIFNGSNGGQNIFISGSNSNTNGLIISNGNGGAGVIYDSFYNPPTYTKLVVANAPFSAVSNNGVAQFNVNQTGNYLTVINFALAGLITSNPSTDAFQYYLRNLVNVSDITQTFLIIPTINLGYLFNAQISITRQLVAGTTYNVGVTIFGTPNVTSLSYINVTTTKISL